MFNTADLLKVIDAFLLVSCSWPKPVPENTLSGRIFGDQKKIRLMRGGGAIYLDRANEALRWLSRNWHPDMVWPDGIERPVEMAEAA